MAGALPGEGFDVERYTLALRPDLATGSVSGVETMILRSAVDRLTTVAFTPNALRIDRANADGASITVTANAQAIVFPLPRPLRRGQRMTLRFRVAGTPARGITKTPAGLYTSYFACDWMVCLQDSPGDKAWFDLDLFLPAGAQSIGVGRAAPARLLTGGLALHRWRSTRRYSPYLYAFAAGRLRSVSAATAQGDLTNVDATGDAADLPGYFADSAGIAAFFAGKAGMALPDDRYTQILVPGDEAQEAAGFALIGENERDEERADPGSEWVVAHEMAHQWWGNLVTCATWRDFWLNEGIATFMVAAWKEQERGPAGYRQELAAAQRRVDRVRALGWDRPLAWGGRYPSLGARRAIQYSKGALFLARLREEVGDTAFWAGLRDFTRRHAGGTVTSVDFQRSVQRASGRDLTDLFDDWVFGNRADISREG